MIAGVDLNPFPSGDIIRTRTSHDLILQLIYCKKLLKKNIS